MWNYQSQVPILGPVGYGPTTLPLRHSDGTKNSKSEKEKKGFPTVQPSTSNKENTGKGFGGLAAAENNEKEMDFFVTGYQDGTDYWTWH
nr:hypothetical protein [Tanacetum cinerariifolium]